ncbi:Pre-mRNA cleavage complex 2 protein Pcf11 [Chionoecetes opilio]|uniref:Pre-mRNA cleavage complex 2 protein Pcf11 n=1 Tax=Chionoecetes opilio TaxID=41210 RepID=A0A8J4XNK8_CHIOP|nr:Pre-mRNA cleavage complex 2 protein Pcf11 [Chionoecetes opilio]
MLEDEWTGEPELPYVSEETLKAAAREAETRTIEIDGVPREIRTYGETAVILLDWNDPRILTFGEVHCNIVFDDGKFVLPMHIGEDYKEFTIDGETHRIKLGVPTQELMLDGRGYQCFYGGKPITVHLAGQPRTVYLDGKPPNVNIGPITNTEFVAGKVQLVIHAKKVVNLFLDAKPQRFNIDGKPFVMQFTDSLRAITINTVRFHVEFGGLPIGISVRGFRRFLRFTSLPPGVVPGKVHIRGMESDAQKKAGLPPPPPIPDKFLDGNRGSPSIVDLSRTIKYPMDKPPPIPVSIPEGVFGSRPGPTRPMGPNPPRPGMPVPPQLKLSGPPGLPPPPAPPQLPASLTQMPPPIPAPIATQAPPITPIPLPNVMVANMGQPVVSMAVPGAYMTTQLPATTFKPSPAKPLDLSALLENLTRTGLIEHKKPQAASKMRKDKDEAEKKKEEEEQREKFERIPFELMFTSENLRKRRAWTIEYVYRGMQCSSCGLRYPPEQTLQYSHHLDWHFRQNKKQQDSTKKANTRKFYFSVPDWLQYEEIEDMEERVPSMFEAEGMDDAMEAEDAEEPSVAVSSDTALGICPACHDTFSQFFHQETEEWRYHNAIQVEGINYHPACHQDLLKADEAEKEEKSEEKEESEDVEMKDADEEKKEEEEEKEKKEEGSDKSTKDKEDKEGETATVAAENGGTAEKGDAVAVNGEKEPATPPTTATPEDSTAASEVLLPVRIKEEPMDVEEVDADGNTCMPPPFAPVTVKQEIKQEPADEALDSHPDPSQEPNEVNIV